uniref:P-type H(+)-exporting transporter n=1 Tax=Chromera velia CCMP2878 TaxID=1169474 RepID=A0A0G4HRF0_9ALVE|eukprot:Cvel_8062.t1-p1 / transcript=Cvel_8062.t1 / gene=Cvel_8062 / organism=Chromera_velia_CCMP2878 / gene_product=Probable proton ATPase 1A, putative / transcript_product=Probable proton ATPase 1A, putative / location=Cvel_scaffold436:61013-77527(+) / protein_length=1157 / sequence_SO=supercontig / SO=protein_coding / is_pseudo=false
MESEDHHNNNLEEGLLKAQHDPLGSGCASAADECLETTGLSQAQAEELLKKIGFNELPEKKVNPFLKFLSYYWGPMPCMIWVAIIVELVELDWLDFGVLMVLQAVNGLVGWYEERNAGNAIAALKKELALKATVKRDGCWRVLPARELVEGDLINLKLGDIVPADCVLMQNGQPLQVDQSALNGESLPKTLHAGEKTFQGAIVKRGESEAKVTETGERTFFGRASSMVASVEQAGNFQKILTRITLFLLLGSSLLVGIIFVRLLLVGHGGQGDEKPLDFLYIVSICVVLLVASIPIAMPVVCTSTMALGAHSLAKKRAIVSRLAAVEELAGMDMLCCDKTGTLTKNELTVAPAFAVEPSRDTDVLFYGALAAKRMEEGQDAIDKTLCEAVAQSGRRAQLAEYETVGFVPFDPVSKRTEATVQSAEGKLFKVMKGAPQVILAKCLQSGSVGPELEGAVTAEVQGLAKRGYRTIGVALCANVEEGTDGPWKLMGLLPLFDPPRVDTKQTLKKASQLGIQVKMITGDQLAIAKETCRVLGLGTNVYTMDVLDNLEANGGVFIDEDASEAGGGLSLHGGGGGVRSTGDFPAASEVHTAVRITPVGPTERILQSKEDFIEAASGFAEVFPEHKFDLVQVGIAVSGATDAARAAADIVLTNDGLGVIVEAIVEARRVFERMKNYVVYRIACTLQLLLFFFVSMLAVNPRRFLPEDLQHTADEFFRLPVVAIVVITVLNDSTILSIAYDKVNPSMSPSEWRLLEICLVAVTLAAVACISSLLLLVGCLMAMRSEGFLGFHLSYGQVLTAVYLKVSVSDFLTVFAARTRGFFVQRAPGRALGCAFVFSTAVATTMALVWALPAMKADAALESIPWDLALLILAYNVVFFLLQDCSKVLTYNYLDRSLPAEERAKMHHVQIRDSFLKFSEVEALSDQASQARGAQGGGQVQGGTVRSTALSSRASSIVHRATWVSASVHADRPPTRNRTQSSFRSSVAHRHVGGATWSRQSSIRHTGTLISQGRADGRDSSYAPPSLVAQRSSVDEEVVKGKQKEAEEGLIGRLSMPSTRPTMASRPSDFATVDVEAGGAGSEAVGTAGASLRGRMGMQMRKEKEGELQADGDAAWPPLGAKGGEPPGEKIVKRNVPAAGAGASSAAVGSGGWKKE